MSHLQNRLALTQSANRGFPILLNDAIPILTRIIVWERDRGCPMADESVIEPALRRWQSYARRFKSSKRKTREHRAHDLEKGLLELHPDLNYDPGCIRHLALSFAEALSAENACDPGASSHQNRVADHQPLVPQNEANNWRTTVMPYVRPCALILVLVGLLAWVWMTDRPSPAYSGGRFWPLVEFAIVIVGMAVAGIAVWQSCRGTSNNLPK